MRTDELAAVDAYCDAVPRSAATVEEHGSLRLFVPTAESYHPWYARPSGEAPVRRDDLVAVLDRQQELALPRSLEWVAGRPDGVDRVAAAAGLEVELLPLLAADPEELAPFTPELQVRVVGPDDDLLAVEAVAQEAFGRPGQVLDARTLPQRRARVAAGHPTVAAALVDGQPVSRGGCTVVGGVGEITGVATLPAYRGRGLASAVTAVLARDAVRRGARLLWLSAADAAAARLYARLGFREIGRVGSATA
ncbi:MAG: GNAT family N-acetyltransferase [Mycobacteriales bacterium]